MKKYIWLMAGPACMSTALVVHADEPPWFYSTTTLDEVERLYMCPDGLGDCPASDFCVTVRNPANQPINNALVEILVGGQAGSYTRVCPDQTLVDYTDATGTVCFNIAGGGCYKNQPDAVVIRANGIVIRSFEAVMSSDYEGQVDDGVPNMWDHRVNPRDLASFVSAYQGGTGPRSCHDYDNNGMTDPPDLSVFVQAYKGGVNVCP